MSTETDVAVVAQLSQRDTIALTIYGEARSEKVEGRIAVASVIRNRVRAQRARWGLTFKDVCLKAWQFSAWLPQGGIENYELVISAANSLVRGETPGPMLRECLWIADGVIAGAFMDNVRNGTHYFNPLGMIPKGKVPEWAIGLEPVAKIGAHLFYSGVA